MSARADGKLLSLHSQIWIAREEWKERRSTREMKRMELCVDCLSGCDAHAPQPKHITASHRRIRELGLYFSLFPHFPFGFAFLGRIAGEIIIKQIWWNEISFFVFVSWVCSAGAACWWCIWVLCASHLLLSVLSYDVCAIFVHIISPANRRVREREGATEHTYKWIWCYSRRRYRHRHRCQYELYHKIYIWLRCTEMGKLMIFSCYILCVCVCQRMCATKVNAIYRCSLMPLCCVSINTLAAEHRRRRHSTRCYPWFSGTSLGWRASVLLMLLFIKRTFSNLCRKVRRACGCVYVCDVHVETANELTIH